MKILIIFLLLAGFISAQDFGFGDFESGPALNVSINGEVTASAIGYFDEFSTEYDQMSLGDFFSGRLNFSARTSLADAIINLNLNPGASPVSIDEAYLHVYFSSFDIAAGLRKVTWGRADALGPLDVINPLNASEIYTLMSDSQNLNTIKIARPMLHASYRFGQFSRIEGLFIPSFVPHNFAREGRWIDSRMEMLNLAAGGVIEPDTSTIDYLQMGLRFTTTIAGSDLGIQYFYGLLREPAVKISFDPMFMTPNVDILYNRFHQIGLDYAQDLFGFNTRAELSANITEDLEGDDGAVYNPFIAWSLGFDRDLIMGINLNFQADQSIRLFHDMLGSDDFLSGNFDIEGGRPLTNTRLSASLSRKFMRDELELRASAIIGIEDRDFIIMPALIWSREALKFALSGGFFGGERDGLLGQYLDNNFLKVSLSYSF
ncbi:MAG: hypothetical protein FWG77_06120 [Treponema sp.]|nr:hypothetical protein [Treponema sp.]